MEKTIKKYSTFALFIAVGNQALSSLANFFFALFLLRVLSPAQYGMYNISFAVMLAYGSLIQGFFLIQMIVLMPEKSTSERPEFATQILGLLGAVSFGVVVLTFATDLLVGELWGFRWLILSTGFTTAAFALKEFFVRYAFSCQVPRVAFTMQVVLVASLATLVFVFDSSWSIVDAVLVYGGAHVLAVMAGQTMLRLPLTSLSARAMRIALAEVTPGGGWAAVSSVVYSIRGNAHTLIVAAILGTADVARINAARLLVTPATMLIPAMSNIALPRLSQSAAQKGRIGVVARARKISMVIMIAAIFYGIALIAALPILSEQILGENYQGTELLSLLWWVFAIVLAVRSTLEWSNQALKNFSGIAWTNMIGAVAVLISAVVLTILFGPGGAIAGATIGEGVIVGGLFLLLKKAR